MLLDLTLFNFFNHLPHNNIINAIAIWIHYATRYGLIYYPFLFILVISKNKRQKLFGKLLAISALSTYIITDLIIKNIVQRSRPFQSLTNVVYLPPAPSSYSFPSGQAAVAFALATVIFLYFPKRLYGYIAYTGACIIAVDRMYMGHHYFSDVLIGGTAGIVCAYAIYRTLSHTKIHD